MAPMHSGFLEEYPLIRVDNFTATLPRLPPDLPPSARHDLPKGATNFSPPHISFLSHPHTDHLAGLSSMTRQSAPIYCSHVTKQLLLALERKADRERFDAGEGSRKRPYQNLCKSQRECQVLEREAGTSRLAGWDLLHALPLNEPMLLRYTAQTTIRVTLLPANHMPGSAMILIEGARGTILHTGDMRAEEHFIEHLLTNTHLGRLPLQHFKMPISPEMIQGEAQCESLLEQVQHFNPVPRLVNVYLDTERLLDCGQPMRKTAAIYDVLQLLRVLPRRFRVHIGCWTSGYEEFLISLAATFPSQDHGLIHVDRYKMGLMQHMALDQTFLNLPHICSTDKSRCPRFCACDDSRCIDSSDIRVEANEGMDEAHWNTVKQNLLTSIAKAREDTGDWPRQIPLPLQRHSPLPEISSMVKRLKPVKVTANTASCTARFVLAKMSELLRLSGYENECERQRLLMGSKGTTDGSQWTECCQTWNDLIVTESDDEDEAAFFTRIGIFRRRLRTLSRLQSHRLELERMDAEEGALLLATNISLSTPNPPALGPWNAQGRYAAAGASPFLTPAMRRTKSATAETALITYDGKAQEIHSNQVSGPILSVELASRYLAYASMFLGWKIRNPSQYHPPLAWKAIRKMNPNLARQSEEALLKELGLAIPLWDEDCHVKDSSAHEIFNAIEMIPVPRTPPLKATCSISRASHTPNGASIPEKESISPLQLGGASLLRRLDEEAASQDLVCFSDHTKSQGNQSLESETSVLNDENVPISTLDMIEQQLRLSGSRSLDSDRQIKGKKIYNQIVAEWEQGDVFASDTHRFATQLNIIGVAVRSRRGRRLLSWDNYDFQEAYSALTRIYITKGSHLPVRGRTVLYHLRKSLRTKQHHQKHS